MKQIVFSISLLVFALQCIAQMNFIRNGSFENNTNCPNNLYETYYSVPWRTIDTSYTLLDTFRIHRCEATLLCKCADTVLGSGNFGVPNSGGAHHDARTGNAMLGIIFYYVPYRAINLQRQYLQQRLNHPLSAGQSYCVTFYVANTFSSQFSINHIGAYLDNGSIDTNNDCVLPMMQYTPPQILDTSVITDSVGWTKIQGNFIATGIEDFITIGDFYDSAHTELLPFTYYTTHLYAYYILDDVSVIPSDSIADAGADKSIPPGDSTWIGVDSNGGGMPCWWYVLDSATGTLSAAIDSGGYIKVKPATTTKYVVMMDLCGTITYDTVTVRVWPLGVALISDAQINIFPNPTGDLLHIAGLYIAAGFTLMSDVGITIQQGELTTANSTINIQNLPSGVYILRLSDPQSGERVVRRVVKE